MRAKELGFVLVFLLVLVVAVACTPSGTSEKATEKTDAAPPTETAAATTTVPQLESEGREDSATMVLLNAPPVLPADHNNFWQEELRQDSCLVCHATPDTGAPTPPADHYYDNQQGGTIFRDSCIQCHATQNDTKPAFNREN